MLGLLIAIGVVVLIVIFLLIFRIYALVNVARGTEKLKVSKSNKVNAILFLLFLVIFGGWFFYYSFAAYEEYQLPLASAHGDDYESLFWATTWITVAVFIITHVLLFVFSWKYQYKEGRRATFYPDNTKLEVIWTIIPAIVLTILVFGGFKVWNEITDSAPEEAEVLEIMGYQFAFAVRYPGEDGVLGDYDFRLIDAENIMGVDFSDRNSFDDVVEPSTEIYLPKGVPVEIKIRARDVLHSVYFPHFRQKMDAMPGMPTRMWFVPTKTTEEMRKELNDPDFNYELACAEICGRGHFSMRKVVVVLEPADYLKWRREQESFLKRNPDYLSKVPAEMRELAKVKSGVKTDVKTSESVELSQN